MPAISVLISTYNEPRWLEWVLLGYARQRYTDFEVVVVDDGSGADTRAVIDAHALAAHAGVTALNDRLLVVRALAPVTEPASDLWRQIRAAWRAAFWQLPASEPRIWAM